MSLQGLLEELRLEYLASIPEKIQNIEKLSSENSWELLETEFHKLKGTGKTYGLSDVTLLGAVAEELCAAPEPLKKKMVPLASKTLQFIFDNLSKDLPVDLQQLPEFVALETLAKQARKT